MPLMKLWTHNGLMAQKEFHIYGKLHNQTHQKLLMKEIFPEFYKKRKKKYLFGAHMCVGIWGLVKNFWDQTLAI